jgi:hypothetical protein
MTHVELAPMTAEGRAVPFTENPRMPSDAGLPSLGLIMQLGGLVMLCLNLMVLLAMLAPIPGRGVLVVIALLGVVRSIVHFAAGSRLADAAVDGRSRARTYVIVGGVHSVSVAALVLVAVPGVAFSLVVYVALLLLAWPVVVAWVMNREGIKALYRRASEGEVELLGRNRGIEGAGALMTVMGILGVIIGALATFLLFKSSPMRMGFAGLLLIVLVLSLLVRSGFHTSAGLSALRGATPLVFSEAVKRYVATGIASVILIGILGFVIIVQAGSGLMLLQFGIFAVMLGAWPFIMNGFAQRAGGIFYLENDESGGFGPAPDSGLTALGYLLLGSGALGLAQAVGALIAGGNPAAGILGGLGGDAAPGEWYLAIPTSLLTVWAGVELVRMGERFKVAATLYAVVAGALAIWALVVGLGAIDRVGGLRQPDTLLFFILTLAGLAASLVLPALTLVLAYRHRDKVVSLREIFS